MMHAAPRGIAGADGGLERSSCQPRIDRAADGITYDPTGPRIEGDSHVHEAGRDGDIGDVSHPKLVRTIQCHGRRKIGADRIVFKIPARGEDLRLAIYVKLPEGTQDAGPPRASFSETAYVERRSIRRDGGLAGQAVSIEGLSATSTDVLIRIESLAGAVQTERLSPTKTTFIVQAIPGAGEVAATYLRLGVEHILFGFDHLLFVLALVILVRGWARVAVTVTAL